MDDFDLFDDLDTVSRTQSEPELVIDYEKVARLQSEFANLPVPTLNPSVWILGAYIGTCDTKNIENQVTTFVNFRPTCICVVPTCDELVIDFDLGMLWAKSSDTIIFRSQLLMFNPYLDNARFKVGVTQDDSSVLHSVL